MPRPTKRQINIKMPEPLIEALKAKAESEKDTFTDLIIRFCEQGLSSEGERTTTPVIAQRQLDERIAETIATQIAPLKERVASVENELHQVLGEAVA